MIILGKLPAATSGGRAQAGVAKPCTWESTCAQSRSCCARGRCAALLASPCGPRRLANHTRCGRTDPQSWVARRSGDRRLLADNGAEPARSPASSCRWQMHARCCSTRRPRAAPRQSCGTTPAPRPSAACSRRACPRRAADRPTWPCRLHAPKLPGATTSRALWPYCQCPPAKDYVLALAHRRARSGVRRPAGTLWARRPSGARGATPASPRLALDRSHLPLLVEGSAPAGFCAGARARGAWRDASGRCRRRRRHTRAAPWASGVTESGLPLARHAACFFVARDAYRPAPNRRSHVSATRYRHVAPEVVMLLGGELAFGGRARSPRRRGRADRRCLGARRRRPGREPPLFLPSA